MKGGEFQRRTCIKYLITVSDGTCVWRRTTGNLRIKYYNKRKIVRLFSQPCSATTKTKQHCKEYKNKRGGMGAK